MFGYLYYSILHVFLCTHECMNGLAPQYLYDTFTSNSHSYNARNASQPKPPKARTAYYQRSFSVSGMKLRNSLHSKQLICCTLQEVATQIFDCYTTILNIVFFNLFLILFYVCYDLIFFNFNPMYKCKYLLYD